MFLGLHLIWGEGTKNFAQIPNPYPEGKHTVQYNRLEEEKKNPSAERDGAVAIID